MEKILYPLLSFELEEDLVLGLLVGTDYQLVERSIKNVKAGLGDYLSKTYKKNGTFPDIDLIEPKMKLFEVRVRPSYESEAGFFPFVEEISLQVPVVYGENYFNYYECYIPLLHASFNYYEQDQLEPLVTNLVTNRVSHYTPEQVFHLGRYPVPQLDLLPLKVNYDREIRWTTPASQRRYKNLERLAERYPYPRSIRKQMGNLPDTAWEMEQPVAEVIDKLLFQRANVLLVGPSGVGKSAVLRQALKKIHQLSRRKKLEITFWRIMSQRITASSKYLGEWQEAVEELIHELQLANGILWVEDLIRLLESGGGSPEVSVAAYIQSFVQRGELQLIGEVTPRELESMRRMLPGFAATFQMVELTELSEKKILTVLQKFSEYIFQKHQIQIPRSSQELAYRLLLRYYPYESFPGKGIKFLGKCVSEVQLNNRGKLEKEDILQTFITQTGLPALFLRDDLYLDQQELHSYFSTRIIGQEAAVNKLCDIVKIYKAGLNNPHKPITTLLFSGPTGVGKTASVKAMANYFFGKGQVKSPLVRIDMSEFQSPSQVYRLLGYGKEVGQLVKSIRERPFSVLLLDEVEKADPSVFDALLTVLDEGILVDAYGRTTNFRNTIIIMTSNLGASNRQSIGFKNTTSDEAKYEAAIRQFFRPEFVNRIDHIVLFNSLDNKALRSICLNELKRLEQREGLTKRRLRLQFSEQLIQKLVEDGFDKKYGARPLLRTIDQVINHPLSRWLITHPRVENKNLLLDYDKQLKIEVA